jgi:hypothetical protein
MGIDTIILRYVYKPVTVEFRNKCDRQNRKKPNIKGAWTGTQTGPRPIKGTTAGVYRWSSKSSHRFSLGLHTTVF